MVLIRTTLDELLERLQAESVVWLRLATEETAGAWGLRLLELTSGPAPPNWEEVDWRYPEYRFFAGKIDGQIAADWLRGGSIPLRDIVIPVSFQLDLYKERRESRWQSNNSEPLLWPHEEWLLNPTIPVPSTGTRELIADGSPYFAFTDMPTARLLGVPYTGFNNHGREFLWRQQDTSGRLASIVIDATGLTIDVEGDEAAGATLELSTSQPGPTAQITSSEETIRLPLGRELPPLATVVLRRGNRWLDRRPLNWAMSGQPPGVEFVIAPENRLQALVIVGENPTTEFKQQLPEKNDESRRKTMKTVAAFANGSGGRILFGVTNDGVIAGLPDADVAELRDTLAQLINGWISPLPEFEFETLPVGDRPGRSVIVLAIDPGDRRPYGAGTAPENTIYYVRRGATTFPVGPEEVRNLTLGTPAPPQAYRPRPL
jgi:Putative DNA-binding domain